jgi:hypothetical protein
MQKHGNILNYDLVQCQGLSEDGQVGLKNVAIDAILMLF